MASDLAQERHLDQDGQCKELVASQKEESDAHARMAADLPKDLTQAIMARVPFPSVFKACCLSKSWCLKSGSPSSSSSAESLPFNIGFEKHIASVSARWPSFCLTYVGRDGIFNYDKSAKQWRLLPLDLSPFSHWWDRMTYFASLVCITALSSDGYNLGIGPNIFVMNAITKRWRLLPHCFLSDGYMLEFRQRQVLPVPQLVRIISHGASGYKVLCIHQSPNPDRIPLLRIMVYTYMYDSEMETWTAQEPREVPAGSCLCGSAYMDGKLYCSSINHYDKYSLWLWVYDVSKNFWRRIGTLANQCGSTILRCGEKIIVVSQGDAGSSREEGIHRYKYRIRICEIIPESLQVKEVQTCPPAGPASAIPTGSTFGCTLEFSSDAEFVYFVQVDEPSCSRKTVLRFNVHSHEWSCLPSTQFPDWPNRRWGDVAFEPGLNPFIRV